MVALALSAASAGAQQQPVVLNFDDLSCSSTPLSTYQSWISLFDGTTCTNQTQYWVRAASPSNYIIQPSGGDIGWSFLNGPVNLDGIWASGIGSYFLELLSGGRVVYTQFFGVWVTPRYIAANYTGAVDGVRISWRAGMNSVGIDDITFRPLQAYPSGTPGGDDSDSSTGAYQTDGGSTGGGSTGGGSNGGGGSSGPSGYTDPGAGGSLDPISDPSVTPEPATLILVATGLGGIGAVARRRRKQKA